LKDRLGLERDDWQSQEQVLAQLLAESTSDSEKQKWQVLLLFWLKMPLWVIC
jgi:hypothetical protein